MELGKVTARFRFYKEIDMYIMRFTMSLIMCFACVIIYAKQERVLCTQKEYENRIIIEDSHLDYGLYSYKVKDITEKIDSIKHTKLPFSDSAKYPVWADPLGIKQVFKDATQHAKNCFAKNHNGIIPEEIVNSAYILIDDNGSVFCEIIWAKTCLFDIYSSEELISIFDEIGTFTFPTPVVARPKTGFEIMGLDFWSIMEDK